ncbi:DUF6804 family protein [Agrococcus carbonis]|uniref:Uncharacterized protein n=1 Tax=Agrococcus carbonis TaxID=684552 RepID=A0A1H1RKQ8_9MICO|nr:DUF6804 family protein [Agrococcus carbonis]SDS36295.1 hypothetical protein SAMN04489719_2148 [Agrococcus carbonis]
MSSDRYGPAFQRNAFAPGILAAIALMIGMALIDTEWAEIFRYVIAILALIVAWFAVQAKQWWWVAVFAIVAVIWNPVVPIAWEGQAGSTVFFIAHPLAAIAFIAAGVLIKTPRDDR